MVNSNEIKSQGLTNDILPPSSEMGLILHKEPSDSKNSNLKSLTIKRYYFDPKFEFITKYLFIGIPFIVLSVIIVNFFSIYALALIIIGIIFFLLFLDRDYEKYKSTKYFIRLFDHPLILYEKGIEIFRFDSNKYLFVNYSEIEEIYQNPHPIYSHIVFVMKNKTDKIPKYLRFDKRAIIDYQRFWNILRLKVTVNETTNFDLSV